LYTNRVTWLFLAAVLLGASLLFFVQPLCGKMLLPVLGGTPAVWNSCMVFFQTGLLLGYCYAHLLASRLGVKTQVVVHSLVVSLAALSLPIAIASPSSPPFEPTVWLMGTLVLGVGLPFFVTATCGPLLQSWYARAASCRDPYFLFAAGNAGSFAGLILYPLAVEPWLSLRAQARWWTAGYVALGAILFGCGACLWLSTGREDKQRLVSPTRERGEHRPRGSGDWLTRLWWVLLALVPSSLMLSVTSYLTTDIAAIPLLWVIPLGLYLLSFTLTFARRPLVPHQFLVRWMPLVVLVLAVMIFLEGTEPVWLVLGLHLLGLFWLALVCHGELAHLRPSAERLTEFYLCLAIGGALGGIFNAILAPTLFTSLVEYPLMIALACLLRPAPAAFRPKLDVGIALLVGALTVLLVFAGRSLQLEPGPASVGAMFALPLVLVYAMQEHAVRFGLGLALVFAGGAFYSGVDGPALYRQRSFFGVHRVTEQNGFRKLFHGNTLHGQESLDLVRRGEPLTYYYRTGPIGQLLTALRGDARLQRVGLIGLGTGALASYAEPGQHWTFFEIDPAVAHIAAPETGLFSYLKDSRGRIDVALGDARLTLSQYPDKFGLIVVDAFGSDAIPLHLLTREALAVYAAHLQPDGVLAFHISNRYVNLEPVLANLAQDALPPWTCLIQRDLSSDEADRRKGKSPSVWALLARTPDALHRISNSSRWQPARGRPELGVWTDDFSNLVLVLRWSE
jgi:SAM-dependent methyltransferase